MYSTGGSTIVECAETFSAIFAPSTPSAVRTWTTKRKKFEPAKPATKNAGNSYNKMTHCITSRKKALMK